MVKLERTIWPVGHGAFYTEQLKDEKDNVLFTAVYDCGSEQQTMLKRCIDEFQPRKGRLVIDALFISHFHFDHVNQLDYLLKKAHVNNLYIPQLSDDYVLSILVTYGRAASNPIISILQRLYNGEPIDNVENVFEVPQIIGDNIPEGEYQPQEDIDRRNHQVAPLAFQAQPFWIYMPCNIFAPCPQLEQEFINAGYVSNGKLDMNHVFADLQAGNWKHLQDIYGQVFPSSHNEYSMTVYSGFTKDVTIKGIRSNLYICAYPSHNPYGVYPYDGLVYESVCCLYMGDFEAAQHANQLIQFYTKNHNAWGRTRMLQIPHHGSYNNFNPALYDFPKLTFVSAAIRDKYGHPDAQTLRDVAKQNCPIVIVQDNKATTLIVDYCISQIP